MSFDTNLRSYLRLFTHYLESNQNQHLSLLLLKIDAQNKKHKINVS